MGAGAGYNIKGTLELVKINSYEVGEPFDVTEKLGGDYVRKYQVFPIKCDIDCIVENVSSESYMYGGILRGLTPIKITEMSIVSDYAEIEDVSEIDDSVIEDALYDVTFDVVYGWGWTHATFDGELHCETRDLKEGAYGLTNLNDLTMHITSEGAIEALDTYALGENYTDDYKVVDIDGNELEYFDDFDDAVDWAKENNGYQVWGNRVWYEYSITNSGEIESDVLDFDDEIGKDWTNPNYIDEDF